MHTNRKSKKGEDFIGTLKTAGNQERMFSTTPTVVHNFLRTYTKHGPGSMDHPMDLVHGPPHGPGPWTQIMDHPMDHPQFSKGNRPC